MLRVRPGNPDKGLLQVIETGYIQKPACGFLLASYSNFVSKCTVLRYMYSLSNSSMTLKPGLGHSVTQEQSKMIYHSIDRE